MKRAGNAKARRGSGREGFPEDAARVRSDRLQRSRRGHTLGGSYVGGSQGWRTLSRRPFHRHRAKTRLSAAFARRPPRELADVKTEVRP